MFRIMAFISMCCLQQLGSAVAENEIPPVYPDAAYSRPQRDLSRAFETCAGVAAQPAIAMARKDFKENRAMYDVRDGSPFTHWQFEQETGSTACPGLALGETLRRKATSLSFHVVNRSPRPVTLALNLSETPWQPGRENRSQSWRSGVTCTVAAGSGTEVHFPLDALQPIPAEAPRKAVLFPLGGISLQTSNIENGVHYDLELSKLTIEYPPSPLKVVRWALPKRASPGKDLAVSFEVDGTVGREVALEFRRKNWVLFRETLSADIVRILRETRHCRVQVKIPWYLAGEALTVGLVSDGYQVRDDKAPLLVLAAASSPELPRVERRIYHGRPTVFVNGKPFSWNGYASYDYQPGNVGEFGQSGVNAFCVPTCAGRHLHNVAAPTWIAPDEWDFGQLDERVNMSLQANPKAMITLRVGLALPPFWNTQQGDSARTLVRTAEGNLPWEETGCPSVPLALEAWRHDQGEALRKLLQYVKTRPWASRVIGLWLSGEVTEEWFAWGCNDNYYADYSAANQTHFSDWARKRGWYYASIPSPDARKRPGYDIYPADRDGQSAAAYAQYNSDLTAETITYFAQIAKAETDQRTLVGVFYGYVLQLTGEPRQSTSGNFAVRALLDSPWVDYLSGIPLHDWRLFTNGYVANTSATESILAAGKGFVNENDLFSFLHPILWYTEYDPADPRRGAIYMHQRECASDVIHGIQRQWFSLMSSWHHDAALQREFSHEIRINANALSVDRTGAEEIAFLVDESTIAWTPPETKLLGFAHKHMLHALGRIGAPVGVWLLSDVGRLPDRIKLVVIAQATAPLPGDLAALKSAIAQGGRTFLVIGAAGLVNPDTQQWDSDATAQLTGLPVTIQNTPGTSLTQLNADGRPVFPESTLRPRAVLREGGIMHYQDGPSAGGERSLSQNGKLIWCGTPIMDTPWLREVAEQAGVHCYTPVDTFVYASRDLVSITVSNAGIIPVKWPCNVKVTDLFTGWEGAGNEMPVPFETGQTRLFYRH